MPTKFPFIQIKNAIISPHLQFVVKKLRYKSTVFTFHRDAVLQGLALAELGDNFFPTGEKVVVK